MITYLSFYGIEECEELLKQHTFNAITVAKRLNNNLLEDFANYLLTNLPNEDTLEKNEILEAYLPWNKNIQETCR